MAKGEYYKGQYIPENKEKCLNIQIQKQYPIFRSSYERKFFYWLDNNANVIRWGSEIIKVPYIYAVDHRKHNYYTDIYCEIVDKSGDTKKFLIEIKPSSQTIAPKKPKINNRKAVRRYVYEMKRYIQNQNKWKAARAFANSNNMEFKIITEKDLF